MMNAFLLFLAAAALAKAAPSLVPDTPNTAPDYFCTWKPDAETGHHSFEALWEFRGARKMPRGLVEPEIIGRRQVFETGKKRHGLMLPLAFFAEDARGFGEAAV